MKSITEVVQNLLKPYIDRNIETTTGVLGAKNLLPNKATTQVINGVTFTVNPSGYPEGTVSVNGTASEDTWFGLSGVNLSDYQKRNYGNCYLSGGISNDIQLQVYWSDDGSTWGGTIVSRRADALIPNKNYYSQVFVWVRSGITVNNAIVYPMIRPVGTDDTYVPYAMTNKELTDLATVVKGAITPATGVAIATLFAEKYGKVVTINGYATITNVPSDASTNPFTIGTIEGDFCPNTAVRANVGIAEHAYDIPTHFAYLIITTNGEIQLKTARTGASAVYFSLSYTTN